MFIITILCILLGFRYTDSKIIFRIQGLWVFILLGFARNIPDFAVYKGLYNLYGRMDITPSVFLHNEPLYILLEVLGNKCNLSYEMFYTILLGISVLVLMYIIKENSNRPGIAMSLFMIYPLYSWGFQVRSRIMMLFIFLGLTALAKNKKNKYFVLFICWLAALGFHISALLMGVVFLTVFNIETIKKMLPSILLLGMAVIVLMELLVTFDQYIPERYRLYLFSANRAGMIKMIFVGCWQYAGTFLLQYFIKFSSKEQLSCEQKKWILTIQKVSYLMLAIIPLYYFSIIFTRLIYFLLIAYYIVISNVIMNLKFRIKNSKKIYSIIFIVYIVLIFLYVDALWGNNYRTVILPFYYNNAFFYLL